MTLTGNNSGYSITISRPSNSIITDNPKNNNYKDAGNAANGLAEQKN